MQVAGVDMPLGAVAELAKCLTRAGHGELAMRVGLAVDTNRTDLPLSYRERALIVQTLDVCPDALTALLKALKQAA